MIEAANEYFFQGAGVARLNFFDDKVAVLVDRWLAFDKNTHSADHRTLLKMGDVKTFDTLWRNGEQWMSKESNQFGESMGIGFFEFQKTGQAGSKKGGFKTVKDSFEFGG